MQEIRHHGRDNNARNKLHTANDVEREEGVVRGLHAIFARHGGKLLPTGTPNQKQRWAREYQTQRKKRDILENR